MTNAFLFFGTLLILASIFGLLSEKIKIPKVAVYVITGVVFSNELLGQYFYTHGEYWADEVGTLALSFIGFQIGSALLYNDLKKDGKVFVLGALGNSLGAVIFVIISIWVFGNITDMDSVLKLSIGLGAIAATTAPAGTMAVIRQYGANGPVTKNLLGLVILDDAFGVILFALLTGVFASGGLLGSIGEAGRELLFSSLVGMLLGMGFGFFIKKLKNDLSVLPLLLGCFFVMLFISERWRLSAILISMIMGFVSRMSIGESHQLDSPLEKIEEGVYMILFLLAGCHFELSVFKTSVPLMITYVVFRSFGKYIGAYIGTALGGASKSVRDYIGFGLVPQAGVAVGLALSLSKVPQFQDLTGTILNVIIGSTIIYEIVGPFLTKYSLSKVGEITD